MVEAIGHSLGDQWGQVSSALGHFDQKLVDLDLEPQQLFLEILVDGLDRCFDCNVIVCLCQGLLLAVLHTIQGIIVVVPFLAVDLNVSLQKLNGPVPNLYRVADEIPDSFM